MQDVETAAPAVPLQRVGRISDVLQFLQHELRHDQRAVEKSGFDDVRNAAVDDDARVENAVPLLRAGVTEEGQELRGLEPLTSAGSEHEAQVREHQDDQTVQEPDLGAFRVSPEERGADRARDEETDAEPEQAAENACNGRVPEARLSGRDEKGDTETEGDARSKSVERANDSGRVDDHADEYSSSQEEA